MSTPHVGPYRPAQVQAFLLDLEKYLTQSNAEIDELATRAEASGYTELAKGYRDGIQLQNEALKMLKERYLT